MFIVCVEDRAAQDIQIAVDYYNEKLSGLGKKFEEALDKEFEALSKNPFYQIRYSNIRCKPVKNFPYLIHFQVNKTLMTIYVFAVINTNKDPKKAWLK